jgi:hypothetical protein
MDIATKFTLGQEAVEALFHKDKGTRSKRRAPPRRPPHITQRRANRRRCSRARPRPSPPNSSPPRKNAILGFPKGGAGVFGKMLKESCPYYKGPVKHTLSECDMLQHFYNKLSPSVEGGNRKDPDIEDGDDKGDDFPDVHNYYMIFGADTVNMSSRQRKQERWEVFSVEVATSV